MHVLYGAAGGLTTTGNLLLEPASGGSAAESGDRFGAVLAAGDLGNGATGDLVVGAPGEGNGTIAGGGAISVFSGATGGLSGSGKLITPNSAGLPGGDQPGDAFGSALAIADVTSSTTPDLAIGIPGRDVGARRTPARSWSCGAGRPAW